MTVEKKTCRSVKRKIVLRDALVEAYVTEFRKYGIEKVPPGMFGNGS